MPSVRPRSSRPVNCARFHSPRRSDASAAAIRRATRVEQRQRVLGRRDRVAGRGIDDDDARAGRRLEVDVVDADPGPPDDGQPRPRRDELGIDLDLAADDQRVVVGQDRAQLVTRQARPLVDLVAGTQELDALLGDRLGDEDPHAPAPTAAGAATPNDSSAATCAAATAEPGRTVRPTAERRELEAAHRPQDLLDRDRSEMAEPEDLAGQLALAAGQDQAAPLELAVERLPVEVVGNEGGRDRLRGVGRVGEELEAERLETGARCRRARLVAGEDVLGALEAHQPDALVDLVDHGDGRRPRRLTGRVAVAMGTQVEVDPRHGRGLHRGPGALRGRDHGQTRRGHEGLLRAGHDDVDAPRVHLERDGAQAGHAVDEDERLGTLLPDRRRQLGDRVHDAGRRLVVGQQHGLDGRDRTEAFADLVRRRGIPPLGIELGHVRPVGRGDLGEPVTERADRDAEHAVAGRQRVDDRGLEAAGARARDHRDVAGGPEVRLHAVEDPAEHRGELRAAVVDHLVCARFADGRRQGGRAGDAKVGLEAVHGEPPFVGRDGSEQGAGAGSSPARSYADTRPAPSSSGAGGRRRDSRFSDGRVRFGPSHAHRLDRPVDRHPHESNTA